MVTVGQQTCWLKALLIRRLWVRVPPPEPRNDAARERVELFDAAAMKRVPRWSRDGFETVVMEPYRDPPVPFPELSVRVPASHGG
jgi:hypothetical protein